MILEVADIRIPHGQQAEFDAAIQHGIATVASKATGFRGFKVQKGLESPERYLLMIWWDTLENHTVDFRQGPLFPQWRAIVGPFFVAPPVVEHFTLVAESA
ncbi:MAG: antibiotic biosynthesis monooxygenase [Rhizobiales bacterium]|nr:antibiotic biosynthesis monooxygenase [Rhizobacter sp.]